MEENKDRKKTNNNNNNSNNNKNVVDNRVAEILKKLDIPLKLGLEIADEFGRRFTKGLQNNGQMLKMLPTFITNFPKGDEIGEYLVVDLGGSNLRVGCAKLLGDGKYTLDRKKWTLTEEIKQGNGKQFFDFIAASIKEYLEECTHASLRDVVFKDKKALMMGFTFSYPVRQESLAHGELIQWNKAIGCNDVVGMDVVTLLEQALNEKGLGNVKVGVLLNDTVGTLMAHKYVDPETKIGIILGTGTNAAYTEKINKITKLPKCNKQLANANEMVINTEWGAFGEEPDSGILPLTEFDFEVDQISMNSGRQLFEKMISGMYLGEIASCAIRKAFDLEIIKLDAIQLCKIAESGTITFPLFIKKDTIDNNDNDIVKSICHAVVERSARLCACGLVGLYQSIGKEKDEKFIVTFDGSLYQHYPEYPTMLKRMLDEMLPNNSILLRLGKDESIVGAAVVLASL